MMVEKSSEEALMVSEKDRIIIPSWTSIMLKCTSCGRVVSGVKRSTC